MERQTVINAAQVVLGVSLFILSFLTDGMLSFLHTVNAILLVNIGGPAVCVNCIGALGLWGKK
jgi:hypothetical protein